MCRSVPHPRVRTAALATLLLLALGLLFGTAPAHAALPITFDGLTANTQVTNQFAADGVTFIDPNGTPSSVNERPRVAEVGAKANSGTKVALSDCFACEFDHHIILAQLSTFAETVSARVGINSTSAVSVQVRLEALNAASTVIGQTTATLGSANFKTLMTLDPTGSDNIAFVRVRTFQVADAGFQLGIDDLTYTTTETGTADFSVLPRTGGVRVRQGGTTTLPVDVLRFNGSNGNVTLSAQGLPTGVTATSFAPNPVGGATAAESTVTLSASSTATLGTTTSSVISGTPASGAVGPNTRQGTFALTVESAFTVSGAPTVSLAPCTSTTATAIVSRAQSGFSGPVAVAAEASDGYAVSPASTTLEAGQSSAPLTVTTTRPNPPATGTITVRATSPGLPDQTHTIAVTRTAGAVTDVSPAAGWVPRDLRPGTTVTLTGTGLCPGASVQFGNPRATATPDSVDPAGTSLRVRVPRLATTGPITVSGPDEAIVSAPFTVLTPRSVEAFKFNNFDHPGIGLDEVTELYGEAQTRITIDPCNPLPGVIPPVCPIPTPLPNPLVGIYIVVSNAALQGKGSCYGIAVTSQHIATGQVARSAFPPSGAGSVWELGDRSSPSPSLGRRIRTWHSAQLSSSYLGYWIDTAAANLFNRGTGSLGVIRSELAAGRNPFIALANGGAGHVVVAHDLIEHADGSYDVEVYDPNVEFLTSELGDPDAHADREGERSVIRVSPLGFWSHRGMYREMWRGASREMVVAPLRVLGRQPVMPTDPFGVVSLLVPLASGASEVTQVTDARGRRLLDAQGELNTDADTRLPGGGIVPTATGDDSQPTYAVDRRGTYTQTLEGTKAGTGGTAVLAPGFAAQLSGLEARKGTTDTVRTGAGGLDIDAALGGNLRVALASAGGADQFGAEVRVDGADRGGHGLDVDRSGLSYENDGAGAATLRATLSWAGKRGVPGSVVLPSLSVPRGGTVSARPARWGRLATDRVAITVRDAAGRVVRRARFRAPQSRRVSGVRVTARTVRGTNRAISVRARFRGVPKGAKVLVSVHARRGGKLIKTDTRTIAASRARGTQTYRFPIELAKGRYRLYGSAVVIRDAAVSSASARRNFTAR